MTVDHSSSLDPDFPSPNQDRRRLRRWWLISASIVIALVVVGAAAGYAVTRLAGDDRPGAEEVAGPDAGPPSAPPVPPALPAERAREPGWAFCMEVQGILSGEFVDLDVDFVESRRAAARQLRELGPPTSTHRAALDELVAELEALADIVAADPHAEAEVAEREDAAVFGFIDNGGCDPA